MQKAERRAGKDLKIYAKSRKACRRRLKDKDKKQKGVPVRTLSKMQQDKRNWHTAKEKTIWECWKMTG